VTLSDDLWRTQPAFLTFLPAKGAKPGRITDMNFQTITSTCHWPSPTTVAEYARRASDRFKNGCGRFLVNLFLDVTNS